MIDKSELRRVPAFADLPDDQLDWFLNQSQEINVGAGETYVRQGDPADWMFVILEGQFQWRGGFCGGKILFFGQTGGVTRGVSLFRVKEGTVSRRGGLHRPVLRFSLLRFFLFLQKMRELTP